MGFDEGPCKTGCEIPREMSLGREISAAAPIVTRREKYRSSLSSLECSLYLGTKSDLEGKEMGKEMPSPGKRWAQS